MKKIKNFINESYLGKAGALLVGSMLFESDNPLVNHVVFFMLVGLGIILCIMTDDNGKHYVKYGLIAIVAGCLSLIGITTAIISAAFTIAAIVVFIKGYRKNNSYKSKNKEDLNET